MSSVACFIGEPEIYGGWDHTYWDGFWHTSPCVFGKKVVNNGAFTEKGEPSAALRALTRTASVADTSGMIHDIRDCDSERRRCEVAQYTLYLYR